MKKCLFFVPAFFIMQAGFTQDTIKAIEYYDRGMQLLNDGQYEDALSSFKNAIANDGNHEEALYRAGWCCNELARYDEAVGYLEKAKKINDQQAKTFFELGYAYESLSKDDEALVNYKKTLELYPEYYDAAIKVANIYYERQECENALGYYKKYFKSEDVDSFYYYRAAWCSNDLELYGEAIEYLNKYIPETDEENKKKYVEAGYSNSQLKNNDEAIAAYKKALEYDPAFSTALRGLGDVYYENLEDYEQAKKYFELAIKNDEENSKAYYYKLGWIYNDEEKYDDAIRLLKKAIEYDPEDPANREEIGYSYYKLRRYEEGIAELQSAIQIDSESKLGHYYTGLCYIEMGREEDAMDVYKKLKKIDEQQAAKLLTRINDK